MLQKIPGIEPAHLQQVKDQTAKQVVRDTQSIKVADKEERKKRREWFKPRTTGTREELAELIEAANGEMDKAGYPIRFALVLIGEREMVEIRDLEENKVLRFVGFAEAWHMLSKTLKDKGFLLDEQI
ncbi:MAG TPA: hypothetical protein GXX34_09855 [Clostridia bacterium]|nr:hypothetical protein [Clostridia bacterium]